MFEAHVAEPVIGVAKVKHRRVRAEWQAAPPAWVGGLVDGDSLGTELLMLGAVATLGGGATLPVMLHAAVPASGGGLAARSGGDQLPGGAGLAGRRASAEAGGHGHTSTSARNLPPMASPCPLTSTIMVGNETVSDISPTRQDCRFDGRPFLAVDTADVLPVLPKLAVVRKSLIGGQLTPALLA